MGLPRRTDLLCVCILLVVTTSRSRSLFKARIVRYLHHVFPGQVGDHDNRVSRVRHAREVIKEGLTANGLYAYQKHFGY
jgi:hypothetical protein